ncbi:MAG: hypothetical protein ACLTV6_07440 [Christensenellales bacterium]
MTITVQAACEAGDALPSRTVELTTDGEQNGQARPFRCAAGTKTAMW